MERVIKFENLKKIAKENNYNHVCLISPEGVKMVNFNPANNKITFDQNIVKIERKLKSDIYSPGKYKILLCERISRGMEPDEFYIYKGTQLNENTPTTTTTQPQVIIRETAQPFERALTFEKAIELNGELANLRAERLYLLQQITELQETVNELEQELENSNLSEGPQQNTFVDTLKEYAPSIMAYLDKSLQIKELYCLTCTACRKFNIVINVTCTCLLVSYFKVRR